MMTVSLLEAIAAHKRLEVAVTKAMVSPAAIRERARRAPPPRPFAAALRGDGPAVIAEIKRRSPVAGTLRERLDPAVMARQYVSGGARAISVLTDRRFFGGSAEDLQAARDAVTAPVLRKDFLLEPYQVYESRAMGADAVLLIAALPDRVTLRGLVGLATELGMDAMVEVHTADDVEAALAAGAQLIGINNRDLHTFEVDLGTTVRLRARIPREVPVISESGIDSAADVARLSPYVDGVLVGTSLVKSDSPAASVRALLNGGIPA